MSENKDLLLDEEAEELDFEEADELNESELFDLIDSMYEKKDDE